MTLNNGHIKNTNLNSGYLSVVLNFSLLKKLKSSFSSFKAAVQWNIRESSWNKFNIFGQRFQQQYLKESAMVVNIEEILSHLKLTNQNLHFLIQQSHPWTWLLALNVIALLGAFRKASYQWALNIQELLALSIGAFKSWFMDRKDRLGGSKRKVWGDCLPPQHLCIIGNID